MKRRRSTRGGGYRTRWATSGWKSWICETVKSKLSEDEERRLSTDMRELFDRLLPTEAVEENRKRLVTKLEKIFNDEWPGHDIQVHLFGSSGNLLCSDDSDGMFQASAAHLDALQAFPSFIRVEYADGMQLTFALRRHGTN